MGLYKGDNYIGGATPIDCVLDETSTKPAQNNIITNALDEKLDTSGGTITGNLDMGSNAISIKGKNLTANGTDLLYNGKKLDTPPVITYLDVRPVDSNFTGGARLLKLGKIRIFTTSGYIKKASSGTATYNTLDSGDRPNQTAKGAFVGISGSQCYANVTISTSGVISISTGTTNSLYGQVMWVTN